MSDNLRSLPGKIFLLADVVKSELERAGEKNESSEIRQLLNEAVNAVDVIVLEAKAAQSEIDSAESGLTKR